MPKLDLDEVPAFKHWYEMRTGRSVDMTQITTDNPMLVQLMFEMAHGESLRAFAVQFKRRLSRLHSFEPVRTVLAINALYMDAPLSLFPSDANRDALELLCGEEQLHFRTESPASGSKMHGVRLAHAHLAWRIFVEWTDSSATLSKFWARELAKVLAIAERDGTPQLASNLLHQLMITSRLSDADEDSASSPAAYRRELIRELYRLHVSAHGGNPTPQTLPRWLDMEYKILGLGLDPDPTECATARMSDAIHAPPLHGSVAAWVWLLSESRSLSDKARLQETVRGFLMHFSNSVGLGPALNRIFSKARDLASARGLVRDWLVEYPKHPQAYQLLAPLVAANPQDAEVRKQATDWLADNPKHPQAYQLLAPLVAANPQDAEVRKQATDWLADNPKHPQAYQILAPLVAANPQDAEVRKQATDWLADNPKHPQAYQLLAPLVAANPQDAEVRKQATDWLADNPKHPQAYQLLAPLVAANPQDAEVRKQATDWLADNPKHPQAYQLLAPLVAANPQDAEVRKQATDWLADNPKHPQAYHVLAPLVAANPQDAEVRKQATDWLADNSKHPQAYHVLAPLVAANPQDAEVRKQATDWLADNSKHPQAYWLAAPLVAAIPDDREFKRSGENGWRPISSIRSTMCSS